MLETANSEFVGEWFFWGMLAMFVGLAVCGIVATCFHFVGASKATITSWGKVAIAALIMWMIIMLSGIIFWE